ncbi:TonB family protein [Gibbsiella quercinecans]|uniref:TonB family protein n=1 Tax=Gibbsiella quercinecans TaxID=929813 RepID=UPI003A4D5881
MMKNPKSPPSLWRYAAFLLFSTLLHLGLIAMIQYAARSKQPGKELMGKAGDSLNFTLVQMQHTAPEIGQTAPTPAHTPPPIDKIALPLADKPRIIVPQKRPATPMERKPTTEPVKKTVTKVPPVQKPSPQLHSSKPPVVGHQTELLTANTSGASLHASSAASSGRTATSPDGNNGQAKQGAGSANAQKLTALTRRVNYPSRARSLGVEGRVRVRFDVTASGTVTNIRMLSEEPAGVFAASVVKDMARWRYRAQTAMADQHVSIVFKLDGNIRLEN